MFLGLMKMCAMDDTGFFLDVSYFLLNFGLGVVLLRFVLYFCRTKKVSLIPLYNAIYQLYRAAHGIYTIAYVSVFADCNMLLVKD